MTLAPLLKPTMSLEASLSPCCYTHDAIVHQLFCNHLWWGTAKKFQTFDQTALNVPQEAAEFGDALSVCACPTVPLCHDPPLYKNMEHDVHDGIPHID
jgi:hypothetical protein